MNRFNLVPLLRYTQQINYPVTNIIVQLSTVPKATGGQAIGKKRFRLPVEQDLAKLQAECCGANYFKDSPPILLKDDSEYPDWLWKIPCVPPRLHELDLNTKEYWIRAEVVGRQREWKLRKFLNVSSLLISTPNVATLFSLFQKRELVVGTQLLKERELLYRKRFRALAKYHYNAGHDVVEHHEREDTWNMHKKELYRVPQDSRPFYLGLDKLPLPQVVTKMNIFRNKKKIGHFGL